MKKTVFTLDINNYLPEMTKYTFPFMEYWAEKIGAEFKIITENKFPNYCPSYNKFQIYELGKNNDFNIFVDADTFIHPHFWDITAPLNLDECLFTGKDFSPVRFKVDEDFEADGRFIGACSWFIVAGCDAHELWKPSEFKPKEIANKIYPTQGELKEIRMKPEHLQDDYTFSKNIAKYRINHLTYNEMKTQKGVFDQCKFEDYLMHNYNWTPIQKTMIMQDHVAKQDCVKFENDRLVPIYK